MTKPEIDIADPSVSVARGSRPSGIDGVVVVGAGSILHPARKVGADVEVLCKCASAKSRVGRPPIRFLKGLKPNCPGAGRLRGEARTESPLK